MTQAQPRLGCALVFNIRHEHETVSYFMMSVGFFSGFDKFAPQLCNWTTTLQITPMCEREKERGSPQPQTSSSFIVEKLTPLYFLYFLGPERVGRTIVFACVCASRRGWVPHPSCCGGIWVKGIGMYFKEG